MLLRLASLLLDGFNFFERLPVAFYHVLFPQFAIVLMQAEKREFSVRLYACVCLTVTMMPFGSNRTQVREPYRRLGLAEGVASQRENRGKRTLLHGSVDRKGRYG